jgi:antitoxin component YwqK of YwqJK toxin-antitoxin module
MAPKALLIKSVCIAALLLLLACNNTKHTPPNVLITSTDTVLHNVNACWYVKAEKFNGYIVEQDSGVLVSKLPIINGKENGRAFGWFKNGNSKFERDYLNGNRQGVHKGWYNNGMLAFLFVFNNDKYEGQQRSFFKSGHTWQILNYVHGYEEGRQKSWNDSGRVVNNFTVKNGKLYGVIGRFDCMSVLQN